MLTKPSDISQMSIMPRCSDATVSTWKTACRALNATSIITGKAGEGKIICTVHQTCHSLRLRDRYINCKNIFKTKKDNIDIISWKCKIRSQYCSILLQIRFRATKINRSLIKHIMRWSNLHTILETHSHDRHWGSSLWVTTTPVSQWVKLIRPK